MALTFLKEPKDRGTNSTVKAADRIVVMRKGTIIEEGNHQGLLDQSGHYAELYNTYFRNQSLAYVEQVKDMVSK